ncbi:MAG: hypothetical protein ACJA08_000479 [Cyclobacteriaceae bacterium]
MNLLFRILLFSVFAFIANIVFSMVTDTLYIDQDAHIRGGSYSNDNHGDAIKMEIKESNNASYTRRTYLQFDLGAYRAISSAKLLVYGSAQQEMTVSAYKVYPDTWSESTLTWNNASSFNAFIDSAIVTTTDQWVEFDVTSAAQDEMNGGNKSFSVGLKDDFSLVKTVFLYSKENSSSQYKARLVVEGESATKDVYFIIGQSNTAGRAEIEAQDTVSLNDVYLLNDVNSWIPAKNPLNAYSTIRKDLVHQKLGYAYTFGEMVHRVTGKDIGLVVNARGGSNINEWLKGANAGYFDSAYVRISAALALPNTQLKGILWHQGESNKNDTLTYLSKLKSLITDFRDTLDMPNLSFIAGQISQLRPENSNFNKLIRTLPDSVANTDIVESFGLMAFDSTHFDSESQRILGRRYASKVLEMQYGYQYMQDTIWVTEDAHVQDGSFGDTNFGTEDLLRVKEITTSGYTRRTYLKFNLQGINGYIVDASLKINGYVNDNESFEVGFYGAADDWAEGSLSWNNRPAMSNKFYTLPVEGSSYKSYTVFATSLVNQEYESDSIVSIGLKDNAVTTSQLKVTSKENQTYQHVRPYILVDYVTDQLSSGSRTGAVFKNLEADFDLPMDELRIYPNPVINGALKLQSGKAFVGIKVVDMKGAIVYQLKDIHSNQLSMDLSFLNPGIYIIHALDIDQHVYATRIMKP